MQVHFCFQLPDSSVWLLGNNWQCR